MSLGSLPTVFSNFHSFHCFSTAGFVSVLSSVKPLVIQALECTKLSAPSSVTAGLMAVSLWQPHLCKWLFWTKSIVLNQDHLMYFIILKTDHNEQTTSCYFDLIQNCVSTFFGALNEVLWQMPIVSSHCDYFSWHLFNRWCKFNIFFHSIRA